MNRTPYGYCQCGCGSKTSINIRDNAKRKEVKDEPQRFIKGHVFKNNGPDYVVAENGCWIWQKAIADTGYGTTTVDGKTVIAHIKYYEDKYGKTPPGLELDHLCRTRACVNPDHFEPVTHQVNVQRGQVTKLTPDDIRAIKKHRSEAKTMRAIASIFDINSGTVCRILQGERWGNILQ